MTPQHSRLQVRSVADFLAAVPYLLGFHPEDSVVTVALQGPRVVFVARGDLLAPNAPRTEIRAALEQLAAVVARQSATAAVIIGYGPANQVDPVMVDAEEVFAAYGVRVHDALRVADGRYFSYLCHEPTCCPPEGTSFDPTSSVIAAYATVAGQVALPNRTVLAAQLAPVDGPARQAMQQATERARTRLLGLVGATATGHDACPSPIRLRAAARDAAPLDEQLAAIDARIRQAGQDAVGQAFVRLRGDGRLTDDEAAWLTLLLDYLPVRDFAWANTDDRIEHVQLWTDLTRRAEPELVPAPASLLAFAAWRRGDGALANVALDRALAADPTYRMALLLSTVIRRGIPPSALRDWPALAEATPCERRPDAE